MFTHLYATLAEFKRCKLYLRRLAILLDDSSCDSSAALWPSCGGGATLRQRWYRGQGLLAQFTTAVEQSKPWNSGEQRQYNRPDLCF